jgi:peptidoglycan/xylan/chitin deacetylase (PgdA/CDA1 family)
MINIHVDIDNLWVYKEEYKISFNKDPDYIFKYSLPHMLKIFKKYNIKATLFFVGKDLFMKSAQTFINLAIRYGHKIGNHTYSHPINFGGLSYQKKMEEIKKCHVRILKTTGYEPIGFRSPGYYFDNEVRDILMELNYVYDSSILPGCATFLIGLYAKLKRLPSKDKTFGRMRYIVAQRKLKIISPRKTKKILYELPISVMPILRLPTHSSFVYLLGENYLKLIKKIYRLFPKNHVYLFHAIDFIDIEDKSSPLPTLRLSFSKRMRLIENILLFLKEISDEINTTESNLNSGLHLSM